MIIANIVGGLGNQMFQYACSLSLARDLAAPLKFTTDLFGQYTYHNGPELEAVFGINLDIASRTELRRMIGAARVAPAVRRALAWQGLRFMRGRHFLVEPSHRHWTELGLHACRGAYLQGYWQSELYFDRHAATVRKEFTFKEPLRGRNEEVARAVVQSPSVSMHIRRGDYVSNPKTLALHGVCNMDYYARAIECVRNRVHGAQFFAFTDDPQWVRTSVLPRFPDVIMVEGNQGSQSHNDMQLMSLCRHHIVANSSFSWWAAWLGERDDTIVIAPERWFAAEIDSGDIVPMRWERM